MAPVLIGGTSNVGKSTVARAVAATLGCPSVSTDGLARHPGRPWRTPERAVPEHVAEHYAALPVGELIASVLDHYARLWPRIEDLVRADEGSLVVEGSALWPELVARSSVANAAAVWLTADPDLLRARVHEAGGYADASLAERHLMTKFLARTERYQELMIDAVDRLGLHRLHVDAAQPVEDVAAAVLAAVRP